MSHRDLMLKLFRHAAPYRGFIAIVLTLALAQSLANLYLPRLMSDIVDVGITRGDAGAIVRIGGWMLLMAFAATICAVAGNYFAARVSTGFGAIVRERVFTRVSFFSIHQFAQFGTASLITRTTNDTTQVQQVLLMLLSMVVAAPMMAIGGVVLALSQDVSLAWVLMASIPVLFAVFLLIMRRAIPLFQVMQRKLDRLNLILDEQLTGVRVIRAFDRGEYEQRRFDVANLDATSTALAVNRLVAFLMPAMLLMLNLTGVAIIWFGSLRIDAGAMQVGAMIASLQYAMQILFAVFMVTAMFVMLPRAAASAQRINEVLDIDPEVVDPPLPASPGPQRGPSTPLQTPSLRSGRVEFDHVTFQYPGAEEPALCDVAFVAQPGEVTAIIGGTGSGKSTLAGLIPRFYDVNAGRVLVDGVDVRDVRQHDLRARIGFVPQKAVLFSGTIAENIRFGRTDATDEEVRLAAEVAQALEFITQMPDGFNTRVAQGGTNLSGGQRQRLAIARALVRRPEIYVFDDSFSALDFATDARLRAALRHEVADATMFIVSQRIGTIMNAHRIVVLDDGGVAGVGTHDSLLATNPIYREIAQSQASIEEVA